MGETVILVPVCVGVVFHVTVPAQPVADKVDEAPLIMVIGEADRVGATGLGFTVTVTFAGNDVPIPV